MWFHNGSPISNCHPEARSGPLSLSKGSPVNASDLVATSRLFGQGLWPKSQEAAIKSDILREIFRPTTGLRTVVDMDSRVELQANWATLNYT